jgi:hypothetical protein
MSGASEKAAAGGGVWHAFPAIERSKRGRSWRRFCRRSHVPSEERSVRRGDPAWRVRMRLARRVAATVARRGLKTPV